jgi:hypothetical protein
VKTELEMAAAALDSIRNDLTELQVEARMAQQYSHYMALRGIKHRVFDVQYKLHQLVKG